MVFFTLNKIIVTGVMAICFIMGLFLSLDRFTGYALYDGSYLQNISLIGLIFFLLGLFAAFYLVRAK